MQRDNPPGSPRSTAYVHRPPEGGQHKEIAESALIYSKPTEEDDSSLGRNQRRFHLPIYGRMSICLSGCSCRSSGTSLWGHGPLKTRPFTSHSKKASPEECSYIRSCVGRTLWLPHLRQLGKYPWISRQSQFTWTRLESVFRKVSHRGSLFIHTKLGILWRKMWCHGSFLYLPLR